MGEGVPGHHSNDVHSSRKICSPAPVPNLTTKPVIDGAHMHMGDRSHEVPFATPTPATPAAASAVLQEDAAACRGRNSGSRPPLQPLPSPPPHLSASCPRWLWRRSAWPSQPARREMFKCTFAFRKAPPARRPACFDVVTMQLSEQRWRRTPGRGPPSSVGRLGTARIPNVSEAHPKQPSRLHSALASAA
eukprot:10315513-Alexandrium_andersonii.AAC.1